MRAPPSAHAASDARHAPIARRAPPSAPSGERRDAAERAHRQPGMGCRRRAPPRRTEPPGRLSRRRAPSRCRRRTNATPDPTLLSIVQKRSATPQGRRRRSAASRSTLSPPTNSRRRPSGWRSRVAVGGVDRTKASADRARRDFVTVRSKAPARRRRSTREPADRRALAARVRSTWRPRRLRDYVAARQRAAASSRRAAARNRIKSVDTEHKPKPRASAALARAPSRQKSPANLPCA